jgi:hypothetical protein
MDWTVEPWFKRQGMAIVAPEDGPALSTPLIVVVRAGRSPAVGSDSRHQAANGAAIPRPSQPRAAGGGVGSPPNALLEGSP